jgi:hypothetical protein
VDALRMVVTAAHPGQQLSALLKVDEADPERELKLPTNSADGGNCLATSMCPRVWFAYGLHGLHVVCMWFTCGLHVVCIWFAYGLHVVALMFGRTNVGLAYLPDGKLHPPDSELLPPDGEFLPPAGFHTAYSIWHNFLAESNGEFHQSETFNHHQAGGKLDPMDFAINHVRRALRTNLLDLSQWDRTAVDAACMALAHNGVFQGLKVPNSFRIPIRPSQNPNSFHLTVNPSHLPPTPTGRSD